jgi:hypothetical protein
MNQYHGCRYGKKSTFPQKTLHTNIIIHNDFTKNITNKHHNFTKNITNKHHNSQWFYKKHYKQTSQWLYKKTLQTDIIIHNDFTRQ